MFNRYGKLTMLLAFLLYTASIPSVYPHLKVLHPYFEPAALKIIAAILFAMAMFGKIVGGILIFIAIGNLLTFFWTGASDFLKVKQSFFLFLFGLFAFFVGSDLMNNIIAKDHKRDKKCRTCKGKGGEEDERGRYIVCSECGGTGRRI